MLGVGSCPVAIVLDNRSAFLKVGENVAPVGTVAVVFFDVRALTVAGPAISCIVTVLWLVAITNAFNFLDNMDGLSAGVAAICAAALLGAAAGIGQLFVTGWLCVILGALLGFLPHNYPPAKVFMGDAGSLVIGFLIAVASCLTDYPSDTSIPEITLMPRASRSVFEVRHTPITSSPRALSCVTSWRPMPRLQPVTSVVVMESPYLQDDWRRGWDSNPR